MALIGRAAVDAAASDASDPRSWASSTSRPTRSATAATVRAAGRRDRARRRDGRGRAPTSSTSAASRPGPAPSASTADEEQRARHAGRRASSSTRGITVSIDTMNASTALAAVEAGAAIINDVSGGLADPAMARVVAETGVHYVAMHWRGQSATMDALAVYDDVVREVRAELKHAHRRADRRRGRPERIIARPRPRLRQERRAQLAAARPPRRARALGYRLLIGASRKRFLGALLPEGAPTQRARPADRRHQRARRAGRSVGRARARCRRRPAHALDVLERMAADGATRLSSPTSITLTGLRAHGHHGVFEHERANGPGLRHRRDGAGSTSRAAAASDDLDADRALRRARRARSSPRSSATRST